MTHTTPHMMFRTALAVALLCAMVAPVSAAKFVPFSNVTDVCKACPKQTRHTITFQNGSKLKVRVIAETNEFFVVARYGEVRVVPLTDIMSIDWGGGSKPMGLNSQDQIILKNGHVLTGSIITEKDKPAYFQLRSSTNTQTYTVYKSQVEAVFKGGRKYTFKT